MSLPEVRYEKKNVIMPYNDRLKNAVVVMQYVKTYCRQSVKQYEFYVTLLISQTPSKHRKKSCYFYPTLVFLHMGTSVFAFLRVVRVVEYECYFASQLLNLFSECINVTSRLA